MTALFSFPGNLCLGSLVICWRDFLSQGAVGFCSLHPNVPLPLQDRSRATRKKQAALQPLYFDSFPCFSFFLPASCDTCFYWSYLRSNPRCVTQPMCSAGGQLLLLAQLPWWQSQSRVLSSPVSAFLSLLLSSSLCSAVCASLKEWLLNAIGPFFSWSCFLLQIKFYLRAYFVSFVSLTPAICSGLSLW